MTLSKLINLPEPHFYSLFNEHNGLYLIGLLWGLYEIRIYILSCKLQFDHMKLLFCVQMWLREANSYGST